MRRLILLSTMLLVAAAAPVASAVGCVDADAAQACAGAYHEPGYMTQVGVWIYGADGTYVEASATEGEGFLGRFLYVIAWAESPALGVGTYGGLGTRDTLSQDGVYDAACVCGATWTPAAGFLWGVGYYDSDGDNVPAPGDVYVVLP